MFFENLYRLMVWGITFSTLAYALYRWGKIGFAGLPSGSGIGEFFKILWEMIRRYPAILLVVPICTFIIWLAA